MARIYVDKKMFLRRLKRMAKEEIKYGTLSLQEKTPLTKSEGFIGYDKVLSDIERAKTDKKIYRDLREMYGKEVRKQVLSKKSVPAYYERNALKEYVKNYETSLPKGKEMRKLLRDSMKREEIKEYEKAKGEYEKGKITTKRFSEMLSEMKSAERREFFQKDSGAQFIDWEEEDKKYPEDYARVMTNYGVGFMELNLARFRLNKRFPMRKAKGRKTVDDLDTEEKIYYYELIYKNGSKK